MVSQVVRSRCSDDLVADSAVSSALRYRAQVPFVDGLLREIGMSSGAMTQTGALQIFPGGADAPPAPKSH